MEILPIKHISDEDGLIFGLFNVKLAKLHQAGIPVAAGFVITAPNLHLKTVLEHYDFGHREIFEQSLTLVKKEIESLPIPEDFKKETKDKYGFYCNGQSFKSVSKLWVFLLQSWVDQIKTRLWQDGFHPGITENLDPLNIYFVKVVDAQGVASLDSSTKNVLIEVKSGITHPREIKKLEEIVLLANQKFIIHYSYEWIVDNGQLKITKVLPYFPPPVTLNVVKGIGSIPQDDKMNSTVKVFMDFSTGFTIEKNLDGVFIASEKIFDLNKPRDSFEELVFKVVDTAKTFPLTPVFMKLADKSEGMGKVRGALRLIHQQSLFEAMTDTILFSRKQKALFNVNLVIPFARSVSEVLEIKKKLAIKNITRKSSYPIWLELAVPENILNLEQYLLTGLDGAFINLDEMLAHLSGFDPLEQELSHYKREVTALIKFLEDGLKLLHKSKLPFIAYGNLALYPEVLDFLVEKGVYGVVVERYEATSAKEILHQTEKRMLLRRIG